jgi:uncharacterized protein with ParB-like and HNH nuclease domain
MKNKNKKQVSYNDWELRVHEIKGKFERGELILDPEWQREYVWNQKDEKLLIDSILRGVPIPKFFLTEEYDTEKGASIHYVIDGQQRLTAIKKFLNNDFTVSFDEDKERRFIDMDKETQEKITTYKLNGHYLRNASQADINFLFQRLNTTGARLTNMEIWNNEYTGANIMKLIKFLSDEHTNYYKDVLYTSRDKCRMVPLEDALDMLNCLCRDQVTGGTKKDLQDFLTHNKNISKNASKNLQYKFSKTVLNIKKILSKEDLESSNLGRRTHFFSVFMAIALLIKKYYLLGDSDRVRKEILEFIANPPKKYKESSLGGIRQKERREIRVKFLQKILIQSAEKLDKNRVFKEEIKIKLWQEENHLCQICKNDIRNYNDAAVDHIKPWAKGGKTILSNAQLAHNKCNQIKRDKEEGFIIIPLGK